MLLWLGLSCEVQQQGDAAGVGWALLRGAIKRRKSVCRRSAVAPDAFLSMNLLA